MLVNYNMWHRLYLNQDLSFCAKDMGFHSHCFILIVLVFEQCYIHQYIGSMMVDSDGFASFWFVM